MASKTRKDYPKNTDSENLKTREFHELTAQDSFLKNSELMAMTISYLKAKNDQKYRCLSNVALTCVDFLDVALNALWEEPNSFVPLLKLLPTLQVEDNSYVCIT